MKQLVLFLCLSFACLMSQAQVTIKINNMPRHYSPLFDDIHIAGTFNNWNPADPNTKMTQEPDGSYTYSLQGTNGDTIYYKFSRGTWGKAETQANGAYLNDRMLVYQDGMTVNVDVAQWDDMQIGNNSIAGSVFWLDSDFFMPQLNRYRRLWVYLPPDYETSNKSYPVIYMQDGQNVFDAIYSFAGEWGVDETMENLFVNGDYGAIVIGIDNGQAARIDEYSPWVNANYGGGDGDDYADFLVNDLKPFVDANFRTLSSREYTVIGGSSMGGLISLYSILAYPDVFGKGIIFSPSFWFSSEAFQQAQNFQKQHDFKLYFAAGEQESSSMVFLMQQMVNSLQNQGFSNAEIFSITHADGQHSEWYWEREFGPAYEWLFDGIALSEEDSWDDAIQIQQIDGRLSIQSSHKLIRELRIFAMDGKLCFRAEGQSAFELSTSGWPSGIYTIWADGKSKKIWMK